MLHRATLEWRTKRPVLIPRVMPCTKTGQKNQQIENWCQNATNQVDSKRDCDRHWEFNTNPYKWFNQFWYLKKIFSSNWAKSAITERCWCFWLFFLDGHRRVRVLNKRGGASYPWLHYHLDNRNGCRLETKSLKLIRVIRTSTKPFTGKCCCKHHISSVTCASFNIRIH